MHYNESVLVSVIIPVYNVENYLNQCVDSVLRQTHKYLEIILIDDGSTDSSGAMCDKYLLHNNRITVVHQANSGLSEARNAGLRIAKGKYVYFLDSDDWIRNDAISILVERAKRFSCDVVLFDAQVVGESGCLMAEDVRYTRKNEYPPTTGCEMFCNMMQNMEYRGSACLIFINREVLIKSGIVFYPGMLHEDELFTFLLLTKTYLVAHVNEKLYYRRIHEDSITSTSVSLRNVEGLYHAMRGIQDFYYKAKELYLRNFVYTRICSFFDRCLIAFNQLDVHDKDVFDMLLKVFDLGTELGILERDGVFNPPDYIRVIWYGAGNRCAFLKQHCANALPDEIWDQNAGTIEIDKEIQIKKPNFESLRGHDNWLLIVCTDSLKLWEDIKTRCAKYEFQNVYNWRVFFAYQKLMKGKEHRCTKQS